MLRRVFTKKAGSSSRVRNTVNSGVFLGRTGKGRGPIEELTLDDIATQLKAFGYIQSGPSEHGFGFFIGGTMLADELLGGVVFTNNMMFSNSDKRSVIAQVRAEADATFHLVTGFPDVIVGTVFFAASSTTGVVTWSPSPFNLAAGTQIRLRSPSPADVTLAYVSGTIDGEIA